MIFKNTLFKKSMSQKCIGLKLKKHRFKMSIYILNLQSGRYYIGKSNDVIKRYNQHFNGNGSAWTKKYKPISIEKIIENVSAFEEDKITKEYMSIYGIDKVRGGSYVQMELSDFHIECLNMEIWGANNKCTRCGRSNHFIKNCYAQIDISGNKIEEDSSDDEEEGCYRCGRSGHYSSDCYARKHISGYFLK